ncbi:MAG: glycosyltransferase family 2 protein [Candidatus Bathyarchaeota archaeon]|nr:glycosyltransferase family 2 protein [Candidatus Bathyarchaeota archaeon]
MVLTQDSATNNSAVTQNVFTSNCTPIRKDQVTIVIPVKNEELAISKVIDELLSEGYQNILVIDGYSTDNTLNIIKEKSGVQFIHQHGRGKTGAVKTAIDNVATPYMLVIDGDFTYPAKDIWKLLAHCHIYSQVIGVRDRKNISYIHRFGNKVITQAFNLLFSANLSDVCSGMYLLNTEVARQLELSSKGFITEVEIAAQTAARYNITEVPIGYRQRIGKGKLSTWNGFGILSALVKLSWKHNPVLLFSALASTAIIPATGILGWVIFRQSTVGIWHSGWALVGVLLLLFAAQAIAVAATSALIKRMEQRITQRLAKKGFLN